MTKLLDSFRLSSPYLWRLRPHAVIPITLLLEFGLPLLSSYGGPWHFSQLHSIEHFQGTLFWFRLGLQTLVVIALIRWISQLTAFPLYLHSAGWTRILWTLMFYWLVIAMAFIGSHWAIDQGLRTLHASLPSAQVAQEDLKQLKALCKVDSERPPSPKLLEIANKWVGQSDGFIGFGMLSLRKKSHSDMWEASFEPYYWEGKSFTFSSFSSLLRFCNDTQTDAIYKIEEFKVWSFTEAESKQSNPIKSSAVSGLDKLVNLIDGLNTTLAIDQYRGSGNGPFVDVRPMTYSYFIKCLLLSIALLLGTELIGGGFALQRYIWRPLAGNFPFSRSSFALNWTVRNYPVCWALGLPRILSDVFQLGYITALVTFALDQLHFSPLFSDVMGRDSESIKTPIHDWLLAMLFLATVLFALREPIERTRFLSFWKNCLHTAFAWAHYSLVYAVGILAVLLTHEAWSRLNGYSLFEDTSAKATTLFELSVVTFFVGYLVALIRLTCLAGGFRTGASFVLSMFASLIPLFTFNNISNIKEPSLWFAIVALLLLLRFYPIRRFSNPWMHGVFLGLLLPGWILCLVGFLNIDSGAIKDVADFLGLKPETFVLTMTCFTLIAVFSLGLKKVTQAVETPQ